MHTSDVVQCETWQPAAACLSEDPGYPRALTHHAKNIKHSARFETREGAEAGHQRCLLGRRQGPSDYSSEQRRGRVRRAGS